MFVFASAVLITTGCGGGDDEADATDGAGGSAGGLAGDGDGDGSGGGLGDGDGFGGMNPQGLAFPEHDLIATDNGVYCALSEGRTVCWGTGIDGQTSFPELDGAVALSSDYRIRALGADGTIYQLDTAMEPLIWEVLGSDIARLADDFMFIRDDGTVVDPELERELPAGTGAVVDAAEVNFNDCFLRASDKTIICLPPNDSCEVPASAFAAPSGSFQSLDSGGAHFCTIAESGTVACWGGGSTGPDTPVVHNGTCELAGSIVKQGQDQAPAGTFMHVAAGALHTCGVKTDGTVACWGAGTTADDCQDPVMACGQSIPPTDSDFVQVAAGYTNTCGLKSSGKVVCWGADTGGRSTPPAELQP